MQVFEKQLVCPVCSKSFTRRGIVRQKASRFCTDRCRKHYWHDPQTRLVLNSKLLPNGCLEWTGVRDKGGYGQLTWNYLRVRAHRFAYFVKHGIWPPKHKLILHSCDNPSCVNIEHLRIGTAKENIQDAIQKGSWLIGERNPNAKLSAHQVLVLKLWFMDSVKKWAIDYGVTENVIRHILTGRTWRMTNLNASFYGGKERVLIKEREESMEAAHPEPDYLEPEEESQ